MTEFPTMVYKSPGKHNAGMGKTFDYLGIKNESELKKALADGYYKTMPEALGYVKEVIDTDIVKPKRAGRPPKKDK